MPASSHPSAQGSNSPAKCDDFSARSDEAKIASYMWYIHVTVQVNGADRLRYSLAHLLGQGTASTTPASPTYPTPFGFSDIRNTGSASTGGRTLGHEGDGAGTASKIDDLTDYLVLQFFSWAMLETLVTTAPIEEHAEGYARALAGIPVHFRVEFCRRLYCLLFSKYIVEWPSDIAVPDPAPGSIAAAAAAAAATSTGSDAVEASTGSEAAVSERERSWVQSQREEDDDRREEPMSHTGRVLSSVDGIYTDEEDDDIFNIDDSGVFASEKYRYLASLGPATSPGDQSTLGPSSPWPDTPSLGYSPELARAAWLGTVSTPLPIQYRGNWGRGIGIGIGSSSRDDGPARAACAEAEAEAEAGAGAGSEAGVGVGECAAADAATDAGAGEGEGASHGERLPPSPPVSPRHQQQQHHHHHQHQHAAPPPQATPQDRAASLLHSAHSRPQQRVISHTGSCCPCRAMDAWSHGVGAQR